MPGSNTARFVRLGAGDPLEVRQLRLRNWCTSPPGSMGWPCFQVVAASSPYEIAESVSMLKGFHAEPVEVTARAFGIYKDMARETNDLRNGPLVNSGLLEASLQEPKNSRDLGGQVELDTQS